MFAATVQFDLKFVMKKNNEVLTFPLQELLPTFRPEVFFHPLENLLQLVVLCKCSRNFRGRSAEEFCLFFNPDLRSDQMSFKVDETPVCCIRGRLSQLETATQNDI